jgi:hypothetical protein
VSASVAGGSGEGGLDVRACRGQLKGDGVGRHTVVEEVMGLLEALQRRSGPVAPGEGSKERVWRVWTGGVVDAVQEGAELGFDAAHDQGQILEVRRRLLVLELFEGDRDSVSQ